MNGDTAHTDQRLTSDIITDASLYVMAVSINESGADIRITSRLNDRVVVEKHIDFQPGMPTLKAFEEMVYENPLVTADFNRVEFIVDTNRFFVMPADEYSGDEALRRIDMLWPYSRTGIELIATANVIEEGRTCLVWAVEKSLRGFLQRTWNNPDIKHRLAVPARYFALNNTFGGIGTVHLSVDSRRLDLIAFNRDGLLLLNSFSIHSVADAAYYALGALKFLEFDNETDRVMVDGDTNPRAELIEALRPYVKMVMPENSAFRR